MKTCKECIYYDVCLGTSCGWLPKICDSFKDASRFIELPCSTGDIVTKLVRVNSEPTGEAFETEVQGVYVDFTTKTKDNMCGNFQISDIDLSVFLTKEEAYKNGYNQALKDSYESIEAAYQNGLKDAVKHGKWKLLDSGNSICNVCNFMTVHVWDFDSSLSFCPHCGAKMDLEELNNG